MSNGLVGQARDMTRLWHLACEHLLYAPREKLDRFTGLTTLTFDNFLAAKSMEFDFDLGKELWLTDKRFPKLQRDYLDPIQIEPFIERCVAIAKKGGASRRGVITQMACRPAHNQNDGEAQHVWGNCMLAFTFHGGVQYGVPTIGLHSRVSYIGYLGALDMGLGWMLGREVARRLDIGMDEMAFRWYLDSLQWHGMKCVPYTIAHGHADEIADEEKYPSRAFPTAGCTRRSIAGLAKNWENRTATDKATMKYGPARRMNIRYQRVIGEANPMPSLPFSSLELKPWKEPTK